MAFIHLHGKSVQRKADLMQGIHSGPQGLHLGAREVLRQIFHYSIKVYLRG